MTEITPRGGESFGELRGLDLARSLKEQSCEYERFKEAEIIGGKNARCERLEAASRAVDGEHGAFAEKDVDAHEGGGVSLAVQLFETIQKL